jgi:hypothetical protein
MLARATRVVQPRDADGVSLLQARDARTDSGNYAGTLMSGDEWRPGLDRPVALGGVQVRVTHAGCRDLDDNLPGARCGHRHFLDSQRLLELVHHRGFHGLGHRKSPVQNGELMSTTSISL